MSRCVLGRPWRRCVSVGSAPRPSVMGRLPGIHSAREGRKVTIDRSDSPLHLPPISMGHQTSSTFGGPEWSFTKLRAHEAMTTMQLVGGAHVSPRNQKLSLKMAKRACVAARALLHDEHTRGLAAPPAAPQADTAAIIEQLTEAIDATTNALSSSREIKHRAIRCRLFTYRAMAYTWGDLLDKALADIKEALQLHRQDTMALKFQARLREQVATRFKTSNPARFVPTGMSHAAYLGQNGHETEVMAAFDDTVRMVRRDRPYPLWFDRRQVIGERQEEPEPEPEPSRWDFVLHRLEDLILDDEDRRATRSLLLSHVDSLVEIFAYYCRVGSTANAKAKQFVMIKPHQIHQDTLGTKALRLYNAMFLRDLPTAPPPALLTLRQFWQLARDCEFVDDHCDLADIDRIAVLASRENAADSAAFIENMNLVMAYKGQADKISPPPAAGDSAGIAPGQEYGPNGEILSDDLSVCDDLNPHHPNNRLHVYEFMEALIRCAAKYRAKKLQKKKGVPVKTGQANGVRLSDCWRELLSENLLTHSCSHESMTSDFWMFCAPIMQAMVVDFRSPLEKIFRYFSVPNPNTVVSTADSGVQQFWKVRSKELLDDTMDFNEIYRWLEKFDLYDANFTPKMAAKLFTRVTGEPLLPCIATVLPSLLTAAAATIQARSFLRRFSFFLVALRSWRSWFVF